MALFVFFSIIQHRFNDFFLSSPLLIAHINIPPCSCSAKSKQIFLNCIISIPCFV